MTTPAGIARHAKVAPRPIGENRSARHSEPESRRKLTLPGIADQPQYWSLWRERYARLQTRLLYPEQTRLKPRVPQQTSTLSEQYCAQHGVVVQRGAIAERLRVDVAEARHRDTLRVSPSAASALVETGSAILARCLTAPRDDADTDSRCNMPRSCRRSRRRLPKSKGNWRKAPGISSNVAANLRFTTMIGRAERPGRPRAWSPSQRKVPRTSRRSDSRKTAL
jgi:hypothetical protein